MGHKKRELAKRVEELEKMVKTNQIILTSKEKPNHQVIIRLEGTQLKTIHRVTKVSEFTADFLDLLGSGVETDTEPNKNCIEHEK